MWKVSTGKGIKVAVLDSGVDGSVPELRGQVLPGRDFTEAKSGAPQDREGHGTDIALLIAGRGTGGGVWGLARGAKILPLKVLSPKALGTRAMNRAIRSAADSGAQVINISAGRAADELGRAGLQPAVDYANRKGSLIFASTGNDGDSTNEVIYPAALPGVVGIGGVDEKLSVAKTSTHGPQVALTAPGTEIPGLCLEGGGYCALEGTSGATAIASASAALIWSAHPDWTNNQVLRVMIQTAVRPADGKVPSEFLGYGVVNPGKVLLDKAGKPGPADVNPLHAAPASKPPSPSTPTKKKPSSPASAQQAVAEPENRVSGTTLWVGIGLGVLAVSAGAAYFLARRRSA
ncbi:S8 family serine peptidase [Streptomyces sp. H27-D2]|uniref:S8 family serine peptidase n=1 Tax=Streptomyces sp. H27-D2 TaxID=3046304 RepID=UPI002DBD8BE5|nr:S8 family serine peptidase [Streptomyces sp. H27-D2]MEC4019172.1 S8 family serine peptidase [Streptomyces sp. H27-D2]